MAVLSAEELSHLADILVGNVTILTTSNVSLKSGSISFSAASIQFGVRDLRSCL